jgi:hypothetical protein
MMEILPVEDRAMIDVASGRHNPHLRFVPILLLAVLQ